MMSLFSDKVITISKSDILKEGFLKKESRFRKVWRERWVVLTTSFVYTFENKDVYRNPTETIDVKKIKTVKTDETKSGFFFVSHNWINFSIIQKIITEDDVFYFEAKSFEEKESWIGAVGKAMVKTGNSGVFMGNYQEFRLNK